MRTKDFGALASTKIVGLARMGSCRRGRRARPAPACDAPSRSASDWNRSTSAAAPAPRAVSARRHTTVEVNGDSSTSARRACSAAEPHSDARFPEMAGHDNVARFRSEPSAARRRQRPHPDAGPLGRMVRRARVSRGSRRRARRRPRRRSAQRSFFVAQDCRHCRRSRAATGLPGLEAAVTRAIRRSPSRVLRWTTVIGRPLLAVIQARIGVVEQAALERAGRRNSQ